MATAVHDSNRVPTIICASSVDGVTPIAVKVDPTQHYMSVSNGTTGTDFGKTYAERDSNRVPVWMGVSSADGVTPVEIYADASGNLLVDSI